MDHINNNTVLSDHSFSKHAWDLKLSNFPHPATIYKKKLFTEIGLFDETFKILADYEWNARALVKHNVPFQYIDIAITKFTTDGVSNDPKYADIILQETKKIHQLYFKPAWLFSLIEKNGHKKRHQRIMEKILSCLYCKKLNRVY